ncbi:MAG TPA: hypothetical protein VMG99_03625 [Thermoplasmata archaeon]|nr:hypothetical protein [Thermoplasmata archaeon]
MDDPTARRPSARAYSPDTRAALDELDELAQALHWTGGGTGPDDDGPVAAAAPTAPTAEPPVDGPAELPARYLEARIDAATRAANELGHAVERLAPGSDLVEQHLHDLTRELGRAGDELEFLSREVGFGLDAPTPVAAAWDEGTPGSGLGATAASARGPIAAPAAPPAPAPYHSFTAATYDRTVASLRSRRRRLLAWTLGLSAGISIALEGVNLLAREPAPPIWLIVLPAVWLVSVPFFFLAFVGTQRTLRSHRLETGVGS